MADRSQDAVERVTLERVAAFKVCVEHGIGLLATELLEAGWVDVALHAGAERAALEAVTAQDFAVEAGLGGAGLDDPGDRSGIDARGRRTRAGDRCWCPACAGEDIASHKETYERAIGRLGCCAACPTHQLLLADFAPYVLMGALDFRPWRDGSGWSAGSAGGWLMHRPILGGRRAFFAIEGAAPPEAPNGISSPLRCRRFCSTWPPDRHRPAHGKSMCQRAASR